MEKTGEEELGIESLPRVRNWDGTPLYQYQGFWCPSYFIHGMVLFQTNFQARDSDVFILTLPKSGTTWLKALVFAILNRHRYPLNQSPILTTNSHVLVPNLEGGRVDEQSQNPHLQHLPPPRIFGSHAPYSSLPVSIMASKCRIVYLCRNPLDNFISLWNFLNNIRPAQVTEPTPLEEAFEKYCQGVHSYGPFWENVLGYWNASRRRPERVLFLKYEDLKEDIICELKRVAQFLGCPFSMEEENQGIIEEITKLCSFEKMKDLEVNKTGIGYIGKPYSALFRKAEVGDWANYLTPSMVKRIETIVEEKFSDSDLTFKYNTH